MRKRLPQSFFSRLSLLAGCIVLITLGTWLYRYVFAIEHVENQSENVIPGGRYTRLATRFIVDSIPGYRILTVRNAWTGSEAEYRWLLVDSVRNCPDCEVPDSLRSLPRIRVPLQRLVALSTTQIALIERLGALDRIIAVGNRKYIYSPALQRRIDSLNLPSVGDGNTLDIEKLLTMAPDGILTFATGSAQYDDYPRLARARLPVLLTAEWMEEHPLARLEWIRFMGILLGREALADSLFLESAARYDTLCAQVKRQPGKPPVVIVGYPDGDGWQAAGGESYVARYLSDAGARYLWENRPGSGILRLSLENVLVEGISAQYWLHPSSWQSRAEALRVEPRIALLPVWKNGFVFQHNGRMGANGSNDFYESGIAYPEKVLADLVCILHSDSNCEQATYYRRLP